MFRVENPVVFQVAYDVVLQMEDVVFQAEENVLQVEDHVF